MFRFPVALLVFGLFTYPAAASDCPTADTAKLGFTLERGGTQAHVRPASEHFIHAFNVFSGGKKQDVLYYRGLLPITRFDDTARSINIPVSDLRSIFPLDIGSKRTLTYAPATLSKAGSLVSLELTVAGRETMALGSCAYDVLVIRTRSLGTDGRILSEYTDYYAPDLSFVIAKRYDEKGGRQTTIGYESIKLLSRTAPL